VATGSAVSQPTASVAPNLTHIEVQFEAQVNGEPFECGRSYREIGVTRSTISPSDLRAYVSDIQLINAQGVAVPVQLRVDQVWQLEGVALLDFENGKGPCRNGTAGINTRVLGQLPAGDYRGLRFTLGVPFKLNHGDPTVAAPPLNTTAMFWNWQGGYRFLKFDASSSGTGFSVHLGSTQCGSDSRTQAPSACRNPNRVAVEFADFDVGRHTVVLDIGAVLAQANVDQNAAGTAPGCMSFPKDNDCSPVMKALGLSYDGEAASQAQVIFRKKTRP
jgi:uncharacterized repeat protein (TIGR04052 family)